MKTLIKKLAIICGFVLFYGHALAQTNNPKEFCRYGHRIEYTAGGTPYYVKYPDPSSVLKEHFFPWGVCFIKPSFMSSRLLETSSREDDWTKDAMRTWNIKYRNYKIDRWGSADVVGIPNGPLFVESCDRNKYNIIYTVKDDLSGGTLGLYTPVDKYWDFKIFYVIITMDNRHKEGHRRVWDREHFINVMTHELGHALGLPHIKGEYSEVMVSRIGGSAQCNKDAVRERLCNLTDFDIATFLNPYNPAEAETRASYEARMERIRYYESVEYRCRQFQRGPVITLCP